MGFRYPFWVRLALLAGCAACWATASRAQGVGGVKIGQGRTYAFLVGCAEYDRRELRPLEFTVGDIQDFHQVLVDSGVPRENLVLMHDRQPRNLEPEARKIREQLDLLLSRVDRESTLIVALSGHGVQYRENNKSYFCPLDARLQDPATLISLDEIYKQLERCPAQRKLLLVDACRNEPQSALAKSRAVVDLATVSRPQDQAVPRGIVALFSCSAGQQSYEHPTLKHGVFFHQMLEGWKGAADTNRDLKVTLDEVLLYTKLKTEAFAHTELNAKQIPNLKGDFSGTWILRETAAPQFVKLFNGRDLSGWVFEGDRNAWKVQSGELEVQGTFPNNRGWLLTEQRYGDFVLRFQFQFSASCNSGIALRSDGESTKTEVQLQDDSGPTQDSMYPARRTGSLYAIAIDRTASLRPLGTWNDAEIELRGARLRVAINGDTTLAANLSNYAGQSAQLPGLTRANGRIGFQNNIGRVRFRNIEIKNLLSE